MGPAIGGVLPFALGIAISPLPIIAIILMLITPKARTNGLAFLCRWIAGLAVVGAVLLYLAEVAGLSSSSGPSSAESAIKLLLGLGLRSSLSASGRAAPRRAKSPRCRCG